MRKHMKIVNLIENKASDGLNSEHGLSIYISYKDKNYLLDTGASNQFMENAIKLSVDLSEIDTAVLSHGHYDHSGGFKGFFSVNEKAKVYLQEAAKESCYFKVGPIEEYIGIPRNLLEDNENRFVFIEDDMELAPGVWLISHKTPGLAEKGKAAHMYRKGKTAFAVDDFKHEQSLVFEAEQGLVVCNSCCHGGADTIIQEIKSVFPQKEILLLIGGFHLMGTTGANSLGVSEQEVIRLGNNLMDLGVKHIYTGHCTGTPAFAVLKEVLGERIQYFSTGMGLEAFVE